METPNLSRLRWQPSSAFFPYTTLFRSSAPFLGSVLQPVLKLIGDVRQSSPGHPFPFAVGIEETEHALGVLERLEQSVEQKPVKTPVPKLDAILVMLDEGVHGTLLSGEIPGASRRERLLPLC